MGVLEKMITDYVKERVSEIETKEDFDRYIEGVKISKAPLKAREEVIEYTKKMHPNFDTADHTPTAEIIKEIEAGYADTSDIGGFN